MKLGPHMWEVVTQRHCSLGTVFRVSAVELWLFNCKDMKYGMGCYGVR